MDICFAKGYFNINNMQGGSKINISLFILDRFREIGAQDALFDVASCPISSCHECLRFWRNRRNEWNRRAVSSILSHLEGVARLMVQDRLGFKESSSPDWGENSCSTS